MAEGTKLADAYVQIIPVAEGIKARLGEVLQDLPGEGDRAGKEVGRSLSESIKTALAATGLAASIGKIIKSSFGEGAALEQSLGGVETLFKKHADIVKKNAAEAYKTAGISANEYMENVTSFSASLLSSLAGDTEKAARVADMAMIDMSDNANKFGTDMSSIQNAYQGFAKQNYTMLDNLKLGYGGTKTEMERLLQDAQKLSGVEYNIDNLSDVYDAIHVIQQELDITGTTAQEAGTTFSGSFGAMKAAAKNMLGIMTAGGDAEQAFYALTDTASVFFGNVKRMSKSFVDQSVKLFDGAVEDVLQKFGFSGDTIEGIIKGVHSSVRSLSAAVLTFIAVSKATAVAKSFEGLNLQLIQGKILAKAMNAEMMITNGLAAGIAAGIALIGSAVINKMADAIDVTDNGIHNLSEATQVFADNCKATVSAMTELHDEMSDSLNDAQTQADNYRLLKDRLYELNEAESKSADEKAEMQSIVTQLNDGISGLNLALDDETGALLNNKDIVTKMIDAYGDMSEGAAVQDRLADATRNLEEAEAAYTEALERKNEAKKKGIDVNSDEMLSINESLLTLYSAKQTAEADLEDIKTAISEAQTAQEEFAQGFGDATQYIANMSDQTLESIQAICDKYSAAYKTQHDLVFDQMDLLDEFVGKSDIDKEKLIKNLDENVDGFLNWEINLGTLKRKVAEGIISQDFYDNLAQMGPKGASYAKAFVSMTDKELHEYSVRSKGLFAEMNDYVDRSMKGVLDSSAQMLGDLIRMPNDEADHLASAYYMLGTYTTDGYAQGIKDSAGNANAAVRRLVEDSIRQAREDLDIHSPSKVFKQIGAYLTAGYAEGIKSEESMAAKASADMVRHTISEANNAAGRISAAAVLQTASRYQTAVPDSSLNSTSVRQAFLEALAEFDSVGGNAKQPLYVTCVLDKRTVGKAAVDDINRATKLNGRSPLL